MAVSRYRAKELDGEYALRGSYRLAVSSGAVTIIAARTASAGQLFAFRWSSSSAVRCFLKYVGAKFTLATAYTTAQETGCDMILARAFTASASGGTAVDTGSTVAGTGKLMSGFPTSLMGVASLVSVASTAALTAGTHTLDANPVAVRSDWSGAIGATVPASGSGVGSGYASLWDARATGDAPIVFAQDEGFVLRNLVLMGATGVGRWDFLVEWDEGTPNP